MIYELCPFVYGDFPLLNQILKSSTTVHEIAGHDEVFAVLQLLDS